MSTAIGPIAPVIKRSGTLISDELIAKLERWIPWIPPYEPPPAQGHTHAAAAHPG